MDFFFRRGCRCSDSWIPGSSLNAFTWTLVFRFSSSVYMHSEKPAYSYLWIYIGPDFWWQHLLSGIFIYFLTAQSASVCKKPWKNETTGALLRAQQYEMATVTLRICCIDHREQRASTEIKHVPSLTDIRPSRLQGKTREQWVNIQSRGWWDRAYCHGVYQL